MHCYTSNLYAFTLQVPLATATVPAPQSMVDGSIRPDAIAPKKYI
jgi:hypothetical protein